MAGFDQRCDCLPKIIIEESNLCGAMQSIGGRDSMCMQEDQNEHDMLTLSILVIDNSSDLLQWAFKGALKHCILMQFGKVDASTYIMDYNPTEINAIQAFAISLSTFDTKLLL